VDCHRGAIDLRRVQAVACGGGGGGEFFVRTRAPDRTWRFRADGGGGSRGGARGLGATTAGCHTNTNTSAGEQEHTWQEQMVTLLSRAAAQHASQYQYR
jgi:hypothetical protein